MTYTVPKQVNMGVGEGGLSTVGFTVYTSAGAVSQARSTTGVVEFPTGSAQYGAPITCADNFSGFILWDDGNATPTYASDVISDPRVSLAAGQVPTNFSVLSIDSSGRVILVPGQVPAIDGSGRVTVIPSQFPTNFTNLAISSAGYVIVNYPIQKNTAFPGFQLPMTLSSDHISPYTGAGSTVSGKVVLDGTSSTLTNSASIVAASGVNGVYVINLAAVDLNGNSVCLIFSATGCDDTKIFFTTQA